MGKAKIIVDKDFTVSEVDERLFGTFIEPIGNIVYGDLYNPKHPTSDELGFRVDVAELLKELGTTLIRFPGGNYVSGYHWKDGIGPKDKRPIRRELAWDQFDTNQVGIDEFYDFSKKIGVEFMIAANLGTGTADEAADEVDYCNGTGESYWAEKRKEYGHKESFDLKLWCLGNEMDGPWQIMAQTADEYGRKACECAKMMKWTDPSIELVLCGSCTNEIDHKTYPMWDKIVLDHAYEHVEYISLHRYFQYSEKKTMAYENHSRVDDLPGYVCDLDEYVTTVLSACDYIKGKKRSSKQVNISFDEWGVINNPDVQAEGLDWNERTKSEGGFPGHANMIDVLLTGTFIIYFLNHADRIKIACQSIVIGSMIGVDPNGGAYRQATFYPFMHTAKYGKGKAMDIKLKAPIVETKQWGEVSAIQSACIYNEKEKELTVFAMNLDLREDHVLDIDFREFNKIKAYKHIYMYDKEPLAGNSFDNPDRIVPQNEEVKDEIVLKSLSWNVIRYKIE